MRIVLVDDHPVVREGLAAILDDEPDFRVVAAVGSAEELLQSAAEMSPDVVLLDLELPKLDGVEAIRLLHDVQPEAKVIVFTADETGERVHAAIKSGARGYLLKGAPAAEIVHALRQVAGGGSHIDGRIAARLLSGAGSDSHPRLSDREREVLALVSQGLSNKRIAHRLSISERTAKFHVSSLMRKLGADNRAQAIALASRHKLI